MSNAHVLNADRLSVRRVPSSEVIDLVMNKHYAGRRPSITYAWGLYEGEEIVGALTIGKPASPPLCRGLAGDKWAPLVYELNRLILARDMPPNTLSWFVGRVLKELASEDIILVSFADEGVGHHGYIYQATNWTYTGRTPGRTDKFMPGGKHPRHYTEEYAHLRRVRTPKHRYVHVPNRRLRKRVMPDVKYPALPYPKGDNERYTLGERHRTTVLDTRTGETFKD